ncbi:MAG: corrinoid protein [Clostridia bacterium]|nr:corrinoid protein [Clostridia bacterium]
MDFIELSKMVETGKSKIVKTMVTEALEAGVSAKDILEQGLLPGMSAIGDKFKNNEVYVPEVLIAARAMNAGVTILKPHMASADIKAPGTAVIGTVKGDLHDIGKNLVKMMLEGKGINVIDLGVDVSAEQFIAAVQENDAQIICCSALLTTTMNEMEAVVKKSEEAGIRDRVFIMVGGAPITQEYCDRIGADCYTSDASSASDAAMAYLTK